MHQHLNSHVQLSELSPDLSILSSSLALSAYASISVNGHRFCPHSKPQNKPLTYPSPSPVPFSFLLKLKILSLCYLPNVSSFFPIHTPTAQNQALRTPPFTFSLFPFSPFLFHLKTTQINAGDMSLRLLQKNLL